MPKARWGIYNSARLAQWAGAATAQRVPGRKQQSPKLRERVKNKSEQLSYHALLAFH